MKNTFIESNSALISIGILSIILLSYTISRAINIPVTHDEASTYLNYVLARDNWQILFDLKCFDNANNHILNTYFARIFTSIRPYPITLRLGSIIAHTFYIYYSWKLTSYLLSQKWLAVGLFVLLNFNPYLLEFFGFARGYAWCCAAVMASLYYFMLKDTWKSSFYLLLGVFANFTMLNFLLVFIFSLNLSLLIERKSIKEILKENTPIFAILSIIFLLFYQIIKQLKENGEFLYGSDSLLDTFKSLFNNSYRYHYLGTDGLPTLAYILGTLLLFAPILAFFQYKNNKNERRFILILLPLFSVFVMLFQAKLFGSKFLVNRTTLLLFPLLVLSLLPYFDIKSKIGKLIIPAVLAIFSLVHFAKAANLNESTEWHYDMQNVKVIDYLKVKAREQGKILHLGLYWIFQPSFNFHLRTEVKSPIETPIWEHELRRDTLYDYFYIEREQLGELNPIYKVEKEFDGKFLLSKSHSK